MTLIWKQRNTKEKGQALAMTQSTSFWGEVRKRIREALNPEILVFYGSIALLFIFASFLSYQTQVYLSIGAGIAVALLLLLSVVLARGFSLLDIIFIGGIAFLIGALLRSDLPMRAVLENVRHLSLFLSVGLTGLYLILVVVQGNRLASHELSVKSLGNFFSVCSTTLSSELCSCLHPAFLLEMLGVVAFLPNQVGLGFVIMMTTLIYQVRLTYESYESRRHGWSLSRNSSGHVPA
jgi:hypothetical protein